MTSDENLPLIIYATFPSTEDAEIIGSKLIEERLAACINIIPQIVSIYEWDGQRQRDTECGMLIKSRKGLKSDIIARVHQLHPYDTPALLALDIDGGSENFIAWLNSQTMLASEPADG